MVEVHLLITGHTFTVAHTHTTNNRLPWNRKRFHTGNPPHLALTHHSGGRVGTVRERHKASTHDALGGPCSRPSRRALTQIRTVSDALLTTRRGHSPSGHSLLYLSHRYATFGRRSAVTEGVVAWSKFTC